MGGGRANRPSKHWRREDWAILGLVLFASLWLFRDHVLGHAIYLGNPDRLNSHLKVLLHYVDTLEFGNLAAWNIREMMGYNSFALPYTFPNPLILVAAALPLEDLYATAGFISIGLHALAGMSAYLALRSLLEDRLASLAGAFVYQFSSLAILKVSQNDMSFAVLIVIPLALAALRTLQSRGAVLNYLVLALLFAGMLQFMFLQKAAYALMLLGSYAGYRAWVTKNTLPLVVFIAAFAGAFVLALPRVIEIAIAISQYVRTSPGHELASFEQLLEFQNIRPYELLRWLEGGVFGRSPSEASALDNNINLTEGFLLYSGTAGTLVAAASVVRFDGRWLGILREQRDTDARFFVAVLALLVAVIAWRPAHRVVYEIFLRVDFTHARILAAGLLPFAVIVALALSSLRRSDQSLAWKHLLAAIASAVLLEVFLSAAAAHTSGHIDYWDMKLRLQSIVRAGLTLALLVAALFLLRWTRTSASFKPYLVAFIPLLVIVQALSSGNDQVNAPWVRSAVPFNAGDFYASRSGTFNLPSAGAVQKLHEHLEVDRFRSVVVCDARSGGGMCAAHMANFWRLRLADGYYGLGVPKRLAALPWRDALGLRSLSFTKPTDIQWPLLALMNVKFAMIVDRDWYANTFNGPPPKPHVLQNPVPPAPRAFFTRELRLARSLENAVAEMRSQERDVTEISWAEGVESQDNMPAGTPIRIVESADRIHLAFEPSNRVRYLVLNELYFPGWRAEVEGRQAEIHPTNAFMRGFFVPAGASSAVLAFTPFSTTGWAFLLQAIGVLLLILGAVVVGRVARPA